MEINVNEDVKDILLLYIELVFIFYFRGSLGLIR